MRVYDEFDNLIFEKDCLDSVLDDKDREAVVKELWNNFDKAETVRMETRRKRYGMVASDSGERMRNSFAIEAEPAEIPIIKIPIITGTKTGRFSGKVENKSNTPRGEKLED